MTVAAQYSSATRDTASGISEFDRYRGLVERRYWRRATRSS